MTITNIRQTSPERLTVCLEDNSEIKSTLGVITDMRLFQGKELCKEEVESLKKASINSLALEKAINLLSYRSMSANELKNKLLLKCIDEDTANYCINKLTEMSLLNDRVYAESLVRHYVNQGYGAEKIKYEFYKRGINRDLWEDILCSLPESENNIEKYLAKHKFNPENQKDVNRITNALKRRGFSWDEIKKALTKYNNSFSLEDLYE